MSRKNYSPKYWPIIDYSCKNPSSLARLDFKVNIFSKFIAACGKRADSPKYTCHSAGKHVKVLLSSILILLTILKNEMRSIQRSYNI